jgi:hypothetical protein
LYDIFGLQKYNLTVSKNGTVTVDTRHRQFVEGAP